MIARGDLGIECPFEELPVIQRRAVRTCLAQGRPVIVATHMLESMISQPVPTRAEITDVANAVYELADCVMLSGETANGAYPEAAVETMDRIARAVEASDEYRRVLDGRRGVAPSPNGSDDIDLAIAEAAKGEQFGGGHADAPEREW
jgi:pyruvate kinase